MIVVPVYNKVLAPDATIFLTLEQLRRSAGGKGVAVNERVVLLVTKENYNLDDLDGDCFYPVGISCTVKDIQKGYVTLRSGYRVNVEDVSVNPDHTIQLTMSRRPETVDLDAAVEAGKLRSLKEEMKKFSSGFDWGDSADYFTEQIDTVGSAACMMSQMLTCNNEERYAILAEDSRTKRTELMEKILYEFMEVGRIANEAASSQQKEVQQRYKEAAIKRQMEHLQKELDEMHPENVTDIQKFA